MTSRNNSVDRDDEDYRLNISRPQSRLQSRPQSRSQSRSQSRPQSRLQSRLLPSKESSRQISRQIGNTNENKPSFESKFDLMCEQYYKLKQEIDRLTKECNTCRENILISLHDQNQIRTSNYTAVQKEITTNRISKETVPLEIFQRYAKQSKYKTLHVFETK